MNKIVKFDYWLIRDDRDRINSFRETCYSYFGPANFIRWYDDLYHGEAGFRDIEDVDQFILLLNQIKVWKILKSK